MANWETKGEEKETFGGASLSIGRQMDGTSESEQHRADGAEHTANPTDGRIDFSGFRVVLFFDTIIYSRTHNQRAN